MNTTATTAQLVGVKCACAANSRHPPTMNSLVMRYAGGSGGREVSTARRLVPSLPPCLTNAPSTVGLSTCHHHTCFTHFARCRAHAATGLVCNHPTRFALRGHSSVGVFSRQRAQTRRWRVEGGRERRDSVHKIGFAKCLASAVERLSCHLPPSESCETTPDFAPSSRFSRKTFFTPTGKTQTCVWIKQLRSRRRPTTAQQPQRPWPLPTRCARARGLSPHAMPSGASSVSRPCCAGERPPHPALLVAGAARCAARASGRARASRGLRSLTAVLGAARHGACA